MSLCRGCRKAIDENSGRNIFDDDILIKSAELFGNCSKKWCMKLSAGIEIITGQMVIKEEKLPQHLCEVCFQNVETYVNFRFQLLKSRDILLSKQHQSLENGSDTSDTNKSTKIGNSSLNTPISTSGEKELIQSNKLEVNLLQSNLLSSLSASKTISEDLINVDDSNTSFGLHNNEDEANISSSCLMQNDQENNNLNDSDNSISIAINRVDEEINVKQSDHDIESEIDVCSGEDDEVLELDVQKTKNETVEINSSSESDIEVCDYEPATKKEISILFHIS